MPIFHKKERPQFRQVGELFILDQKGNYAKSMEILAENGLRPLTYREALAKAPDMVRELKGKWFWLAGQGIKEDRLCTYDAKGELAESTGSETYDQKVRVWSGKHPLHLAVIAGVYGDGRRFVLGASVGPEAVAYAMVGVKIQPGLVESRRE